MAKLTKAERDKLPAEDFGDSAARLFPITDQDDVDSAARLIGKARNPEAVKKRILEICKRKKLTPPAAWTEAGHAAFSAAADVPFAVEPGEGRADGEWVERPIRVLARTGDYDFPEERGGAFSLTPEDLMGAEADFSHPVPIRDTHGGGFGSSIFDGKLGHVTAVEVADDGASTLTGKARIPVWLDRLFQGQPIPCSANWCRRTKQIKDVALVSNPRISDAALFAAFAEAEAKKGYSPHGQKLMQFIHDHAAIHGARCAHDNSPYMAGGTGNDEELEERQRAAGFSAPHEVDALQKIHDLALGSGAACALYRSGMGAKLSEYRPGQHYQAMQNMMPAYRTYQPGNYALMSEDATFSATEKTALERQLADARADADAQREARIAAEAVGFAALHRDRLTPADEVDLIDEYRQAALDDLRHGGEVFFADEQGTRKQGTRLDRLRARVGRIRPHGLTRETLAGSEALFALSQQATTVTPEEEEREALRKRTEEYAERRNKVMHGKPLIQAGGPSLNVFEE